MKTFNGSFLIAMASLSLAVSCTNSGDNTNSKADSTAPKPSAITLADYTAGPDFPGANLSFGGASASKQGTDSGKVSFTFKVANYELKNMTPDAGEKMCANSKDGQHIHFILDNQPYKALYEPKNEVVLANNTEHYLLCFLSRSYHESLKSQGAGIWMHFMIDSNGKFVRMDMSRAPMIFYSRPKGDYYGKDTANVLLDFYPVNCTLGKDYSLKVDIKNENTGAAASFTLKEWKASFLKNLGLGKSTITLTLLDKDGNPLTGPNTTVTRSINLAAAEPAK